MPPQELVIAHRRAQDAAKAVLRELAEDIGPEDTEQSIARRAASALYGNGIRETWYYDCPALVLLGSRSCASVSGRNYRPGLEPVGQTNLVTIDLSPIGRFREPRLSRERWPQHRHAPRRSALHRGRQPSTAWRSELFTFEPHVRATGEGWGFKHEDVFFFNATGTVEEL